MSTGTYSFLAGLLAAVLVASEVPCQAQDDSSPHTERFVEIDQITLHVLDWGGSGPDMVFLTGFGDSAHTFDSIAERFQIAFELSP